MPDTPTDRPPPSIDQSLVDAYRSAHYTTNGFTLKIGEPHPEFDNWLSQRSLHKYCLITAHNPLSHPLPAIVNQARHRTLVQLLDRLKMIYTDASSSDPSGEWPAEPGVCLFDVAPARAREIGRLYQQHAIVEGHRGGVPELYFL